MRAIDLAYLSVILVLLLTAIGLSTHTFAMI